MKILFFIAICLLAFNTAKLEEEESTNIYNITEENFQEALNQFEYLFVKFHAPWCGHCKEVAPEFEKAAQDIKDKGLNVTFGNIDVAEQEVLADKFQIQGLPTMLLFFGDETIPYQQQRTSEEMAKWLEKKLMFQSIEVNEVSELEIIISDKELALVYFGENNQEFKQYLKICKHLDSITIIHSFSQKLKDNYKAPKIVLFKNFDEKRSDYLESDLTLEKVIKFVATNSIPKIMNFDDRSAAMIFGEGNDGIILFFKSDLHQQELMEFEKVSDSLKGKILIVKNQMVNELEKKLAEFIGVTENDLPIVYIVNVNSPQLKKFKQQKEITSENLLQFYQKFVAGKLQPTLKSEEIPKQNEGPVIKVVGKTFKKIVLDETKDILINFYAPFCDHCKELAPIYKQVAERLQNSKNLVVADYNAIANENSEISIDGFPTIQFYATHAKSDPVTFDGEQSIEEIIQFVKQYATLAINDTQIILQGKKIQEIKEEL